MTGQITPDHHFYPHGFATMADGHVGVGDADEPVGTDVANGFQKVASQLVEHGAFVRDWSGQDMVERRDAVAGDHDQPVADGVYIADFTPVKSSLAGKVEICFSYRHDVISITPVSRSLHIVRPGCYRNNRLFQKDCATWSCPSLRSDTGRKLAGKG